MDDWKNFKGKKIKIIYDDMGGYPKKKEGILINSTPTHLVIEMEGGSQALLLSKILRVEEVDDGS